MRMRWWVAGCLFAVGACQGENSVVGQSGTDPLTGGEGPTVGGTTNQWLDVLASLNEPNSCLPAVLPVTNGVTSCVIVEVVGSEEEHADCSCSGAGRRTVTPALAELVLGDMLFQGLCANAEDCAAHCLCEVERLTDELGAQCESQEATDDAVGWCYVSPEQGLGNPELVEQCPSNEQRRLRVVGVEPRSPDDMYYVACQGTERQVEPAPLGAPCVPTDEYDPTFSAFGTHVVAVETQTGACESSVCLVNHFQGRASCPYGQSEVEAQEGPVCFVPGSNEPVTVPVVPQLLARREATASICSCQCDGPGDGPFCECPESMACAPLFGDIGLEGQANVAGSYCVPKGTEFDLQETVGPYCDRQLANCEEGGP